MEWKTAPQGGARDADDRLERSRDAGDRRAASASRGAAHADPARGAGELRLRAARRAAGDRRGAEPEPGRGLRGRELLPRLPQRARRAARREDLPGRGLPGAGLRGAGGARGSAARARPAARPARRASPSSRSIVSGSAPSGRRRWSTGRWWRGSTRPGSTPCSGSSGHDPGVVPRDAAAIACRADAVAAAIGEAGRRAGVELAIVRNGSRGMLWLEPLVEVEIDGVRHGFGPLAVGEVEGLMCGGRRRDRGRASAGGRAGRGDPVLRGADAADVRALRRDRSGVARRLCGARRLEGAGARDRDRAGGDGRRGDGVGAARARRGRVPDRDQVEDGSGHRGGRRSTSSATPTRATAAPSPTG